MAGHGAKNSRRRREAIQALLDHPTVAEAARAARISEQTLRRWMQDPAFDAEYRAGKRAVLRQAMARQRQVATVAVKSILQIMYKGEKAGTRLKAARTIRSLAEDSIEIEDLAAAVTELKQAGTAKTGRGAKLPRKQQEAIAALLAHRNVAEAAEAVGISVQTLYRWMGEPAFLAEYATAARAVWGPAMTLVQQKVGDAVLIMGNFAINPSIPEATRLEAGIYLVGEMKANEVEELTAGVAEMERAEAGAGAPEEAPKTIGRSLYQRVQRLKARLLRAGGPGGIRVVLVRALDGRPAQADRRALQDARPGCRANNNRRLRNC
jgi:hypothetical protein